MNRLIQHQVVADVNARLSKLHRHLTTHRHQTRRAVERLVTTTTRNYLDVSADVPRASALSAQLAELGREVKKIEVNFLAHNFITNISLKQTSMIIFRTNYQTRQIGISMRVNLATR